MSGRRPSAGDVYLDYNASAPLRSPAREAMLEWLDPARAGNASSAHRAGVRASRAVGRAREQLADLIGCAPREIVFTSGATEANNVALHAAIAARGADASLVTTSVEHPAVLAVVEAYKQRGVPCQVIGVDDEGRLDLPSYRAALHAAPPGSLVVSVMAANNETGVRFELPALLADARAVGAVVHTDATQLVGRLPVDVADLDVDMLSLSGHKFGGPHGVGALYISRRAGLGVDPLHHGGGQEAGWRPGTLNVAGIVGLGAAAEAARRNLSTEVPRVEGLRDRLEGDLRAAVPQVRINGVGVPRLPGTTSVTFPDLPAAALMAALPDLAVSEGSACAAGAPAPSHVLTAMGRSSEDAEATLRFSLGHATTSDDVDRAVAAVVRAVGAVTDALALISPSDSGVWR